MGKKLRTDREAKIVYKPFMGAHDKPSDDGPIFVQTMNQSDQGKVVDSLGNSDMKDFKTNDSAMKIVNSPQVKKEFNLGSGPATSTTPSMPSPATRVAPIKSGKMGQLDMKSGEFWGVVGLSVCAGVLGKYLFDQYVK